MANLEQSFANALSLAIRSKLETDNEYALACELTKLIYTKYKSKIDYDYTDEAIAVYANIILMLARRAELTDYIKTDFNLDKLVLDDKLLNRIIRLMLLVTEGLDTFYRVDNETINTFNSLKTSIKQQYTKAVYPKNFRPNIELKQSNDSKDAAIAYGHRDVNSLLSTISFTLRRNKILNEFNLDDFCSQFVQESYIDDFKLIVTSCLKQ